MGKTTLHYHLRAIDDLHAMLKAHGDWMPLGSADEQKPAAEGTAEAWASVAPERGFNLKIIINRYLRYVAEKLEAELRAVT